MNRGTRMIAFNQFLFIDKVGAAGTVDTSRFQIRTGYDPVGGWNFDLANYDAFISTDLRASHGFTIDIKPGNVRSSENCPPLCENA